MQPADWMTISLPVISKNTKLSKQFKPQTEKKNKNMQKPAKQK